MRGLVIVGLFLAGAAYGQIPPAALPSAVPRDARAVETAIELAWLADPITFPYRLRAFARDGVVEIHGTVPRADVRKQALNIAKFVGGSVVLDQTDIVPEAEAAFVPMAGGKVVAAFQAKLAKALPQLANKIDAKCDADGRVTLNGRVSTMPEKMALGEILRRTPGCLLVDNRVQIGVLAGPIQQVRADVPSPMPPAARMATNGRTEEMRQALAKLCPGARGLQVFQTAPTAFQIQFTVRNEDEASQLATFIFNIPQWRGLRIDIDARVPR